jgi:hypothetical protein
MCAEPQRLLPPRLPKNPNDAAAAQQDARSYALILNKFHLNT